MLKQDIKNYHCYDINGKKVQFESPRAVYFIHRKTGQALIVNSCYYED